ncbi:MAG: Ig-like domain-containing protein, partial [Acidimicrobiales bacterium]
MILVVLLVLGTSPALAQTEPGAGFNDDDGNIHEADIEFILAAGITKGCNPPVNDQYCPSLPVSRAQLASFMTRAFSLPVSTTDHFTDDDASVHEDDINAIADAGFVFGCGPDLYCPNDDVTRAQLASVFVRAFEFPASTTDFFVDDDSSIHEDDINALAAVGVTLGCRVDPANFCPFDSVLRDQFASFMARALTLTANEPPVADPAAVATDEDTPIEIVLSGTDPNDDPLTFEVASVPANGTLSSVGLPFVTYTPDTDFFGADEFTFTVSDGEFTSPAATIGITVLAENDAPVLAAIGDQAVDELTSLAFTAAATDVDTADTLAYSLDAGAAVGMTIDAATGVFEWTPTETQGPGVFSVTVRVTDDGVPSLDDSETIDITVGEVNESPVLDAIGDQAVDELVSLGFTAAASDVDLAANGLTFSVDAGAPTGASIDPTSGVFEWTPTESQGPGVFSVTVRVTDDGVPALSDAETFDITVSETNEAPVLGDIGDQTVDELASLGFTATATDVDLPANGLAFTLDGTAIAAGMTIDPVSGVFEWTPTEAQGPGVYPVTVTVTDDGTP